MKFDPIEKDAPNLWVEGIYDGYVKNAEEGISRNGNQVIKLFIEIMNKDGSTKVVVGTLTSAFRKLLKHFCMTTRNSHNYALGSLEPVHCINKKVRVKLEIGDIKEDGKIKLNANGEPFKINRVADFLALEEETIKPLSSPLNDRNPPPMTDEDIPF